MASLLSTTPSSWWNTHGPHTRSCQQCVTDSTAPHGCARTNQCFMLHIKELIHQSTRWTDKPCKQSIHQTRMHQAALKLLSLVSRQKPQVPTSCQREGLHLLCAMKLHRRHLHLAIMLWPTVTCNLRTEKRLLVCIPTTTPLH